MAKEPPSLAEQVELISLWDAGEQASVDASVHDHHRRHGRGLTFWQYMRAAAAFDRTKSTRIPPTGTRRGGTVKWKREKDEFLIERNGKILSYQPPGK